MAPFSGVRSNLRQHAHGRERKLLWILVLLDLKLAVDVSCTRHNKYHSVGIQEFGSSLNGVSVGYVEGSVEGCERWLR
jgi:hypothetical protein